ncbi:MAG: bifunctional acetaldehyde-CoA/alcohol dehydrogenase [Fusobacteria bacterium]|nr:bifunctional acetaldehyde-CoA/alcohol dehydrogenase [Fusobacteriota bacterium]
MKKISNLEELVKELDKVKKAQEEYATFTQEQVDEIFKAAALAASKNRILLAKQAVEETGMGIVEDKVIKNHFASEFIFNKYYHTKTCGVIERDSMSGITKIAEPIGVIGAIIPTTNPTSTAIFKTLLALKTRNGMIVAPHPRAKVCTWNTVKTVLDAAVKAGAPEGILACISEPTLEMTNTVMAKVQTILATGGPGMVKAAYSAGTPAIGVGPGNVPVVFEKSCDIEDAVCSVLLSKSFDSGVICASEQSVVVESSIYKEVKKTFVKRGAYLLNKEECDKIRGVIFIDKALNADIVGQMAYKIAAMAGITISEETKVLLAEAESVDKADPLSHEKLSPVLTLYKYTDFSEALDMADKLLAIGGYGHTASIFINQHVEKEKFEAFVNKMTTCRVIVNTPSALGGIGDVYNFALPPSLTLGCGSHGHNSTSENIGVKHLLNYKTVAERMENMLWFRAPKEIYFKSGSLKPALSKLKGTKQRAFIITDKFLDNSGLIAPVVNILNELQIHYKIYSDVEANPTLSSVNYGAKLMREFNPDVIIAFGGGSAMDAAKLMRVMYEYPKESFENLASRFMDIEKRVYKFPKAGIKASLVCIPTSSGTGSEVTPFAIITDDSTHQKHALADYELTPDVAIVDPLLTLSMPKGLCSSSGIDVLVHAIESYVSIVATEFTKPLSLEAISLTFNYLEASYNGGAEAVQAKEKMAYASCIAGMAFSNAFLGICHSLAHKIGAEFNIPHGVANALMLNEVIRFNATENPRKQGIFSQYAYPQAIERYVDIAKLIGIAAKTPEEYIEKLCAKIDALKIAIDIPLSLEEFGIKQETFYAHVDELAENAFDDQCTGANPRYPLISELKELLIKAYHKK